MCAVIVSAAASGLSLACLWWKGSEVLIDARATKGKVDANKRGTKDT